MDLLGFTDQVFPGRSALRLDPDAPRERAYAWYEWTAADWKRDRLRCMDLYAIQGPIRDRSSWRYTGALFGADTPPPEASTGWGDPETDEQGYTVRRLEPTVEFYAPPDVTAMVLEMRQTESTPPGVSTVHVYLNGEPIDRVSLNGLSWHTVEYPIPPGEDRVATRVDLRVETSDRDAEEMRTASGVVARDVHWRR